MSNKRAPRHLAVLSGTNAGSEVRLTRGQVAERLNISVSTVRRYEGDKLHPKVDEHDVRWFDEKEVTALAATIANAGGLKRSTSASATRVHVPESRTASEVAALVFERLEQRQSMAEIVVGLRVEPDVVRALYEQWCLGLVEGQLRLDREPRMPRANEIEHARTETLATRLAELPANELTRISVARFREEFQHGEYEYARVHELGGFHVSGPCSVEEITRRYGPGSYRVTAYGFEPSGLRWELLVDGLRAA
jgi:DNA-binding transcriptional MerR regulator